MRTTASTLCFGVTRHSRDVAFEHAENHQAVPPMTTLPHGCKVQVAAVSRRAHDDMIGPGLFEGAHAPFLSFSQTLIPALLCWMRFRIRRSFLRLGAMAVVGGPFFLAYNCAGGVNRRKSTSYCIDGGVYVTTSRAREFLTQHARLSSAFKGSPRQFVAASGGAGEPARGTTRSASMLLHVDSG